jgi:nicotinamidase-related amidase
MIRGQPPGRAALIVVDMHQRRHYPEGKTFSEKDLRGFDLNDRLAGRICEAIRKAREDGMPVVLVRMKSQNIHPVIDAVAGPDSYLVKRISKADCDAFAGTELSKLLGDWNVNTAIVCGRSWRLFGKTACLWATVESAKEHGLHVITAYPLMRGWAGGIAEFAKTIRHYCRETEHYFSNKELFKRMAPLGSA